MYPSTSYFIRHRLYLLIFPFWKGRILTLYSFLHFFFKPPTSFPLVFILCTFSRVIISTVDSVARMIYSGISLQLTGTVENHLTVYMMMTMYKLFWAESSTYYDSISFLCDFLTFFFVVVSVSAYLLGTETLCFFSRVPNTCRHGFKHPYSLLAKPASQLSLDLGQGLGKEPQMGTNQLSVCSGDCSHLAHPAGSF